MEDACDAAVVQAGVEPRRYAECLLDSASGRASVPPLAPAMAKPGSQLKRRLLLILHPQAQRMGLSPRYLQLALLLAGILLAACGPSAKTDRALTDEAELRLEAAPFPQP